MCFDADARPPLPAIRGGPVDASDLILTSRDGTPVAAVVARAASGGGPGIVVVPDVRGLHPYYEDLTHRFAEAGVHAVALDLYSRTAGTGKRAGDFEYEPHVARLDRTSVDDDIAAAAAVLRSPAGGSADRIFTVGFCIGGRISLLQAAASGVGAEGVIGFYPWPVGSHRSGLPAPADEAPRFGCAVLTLYGGADAGIPADARDAFARALGAAGVRHESVTYEGAPHSFFDRRADAHADASADAWRRMLAFVGAGG